MAATTQFKQQCPSCEAMVPIKDPSLIGKKVDCPKCKYRFLVEEPGAGEEGPKAKGKGKVRREDEISGETHKKKGGSNMLLIVGGGLGLVAVIGLIVVGIILFGGDSSSSGSGSGTAGKGGSGTSAGTNAGARPNPVANAGTPGGATTPGASTGASATAPEQDDAALANVSNLLPNDSQAVYSVNIHRYSASTLGGATFRPGGGFRPESFRDALGLPLEQMSRFLRAESLKNKWAFNIVQMHPSFSVKPDALKGKIGAQKGPKSPIRGHEYFLVSKNEVADGMSHIDFTSIIHQNSLPLQPASGMTLAWHLYDDHTLIIAEVAQVEQFLEGGRRPKQLSTTSSSGSGPSAMAPGGGDMNNMYNRSMSPSPGGGQPAATRGPMPVTGLAGAGTGGGTPPRGPSVSTGTAGTGTTAGPANPGPDGNAMYTEKGTYLTVKPELKRMLDRMEEAKQPVIFSCAAIDLESSNARIVDAIRSTTGLGAGLPIPTFVAAGFGLHELSESRLTCAAILELKREDDARTLDTALRATALPLLARGIGTWMGGITIETNGTAPTPGGGGPGMPFAGGPGTYGPGMYGPGMYNPGAAMGRPGVGAAGGPAGGGGEGDVASGSGTERSNPRGFNPGGVRGPGMPGAGSPGSSDAPTANSSLTSSYLGKIVYIYFDAEVNSATDEKIRRVVENQVTRLKGMTDVLAMTQPRWHELAATINSLRTQKKVLRGSYPISGEGQLSVGGASFVSRTPNQRVGWMVDLLPFLGRQDVFEQIHLDKPWREDSNLRAGSNWIPQFVNPMYPRTSWQVRLPSLPDHALGATHFTGLSGIGMDSAEYAANDPAAAKKIGMFGYNRQVRFEDVKDGLSNTIYMIQVPPYLNRPWIAGGGATVQGVPEKNSIAPFVYKQANGKMGTYALMGDASVRFIGADIPDKSFQALVTIAGGESTDDLETVAPKVENDVIRPAVPAKK
jgi:hypothetical protein